MRVFVAIKFPTKILIEIKKIQEKLPEFSGKKTELVNLHLTLKFLGELNSEEIEKIRLNLGEIKSIKFESEINEIGFFDKGERGIVWLNVTNCENLQKEIDNSLLKFVEKEKRFMGHLTIARTKNISNKKKFLEELRKIKFPKMFFIIENFYLMESVLKREGPEYKVIEEYKLQ